VAAFGGLQAEGFGKPYVHKPRTDMPHCESPSRKPGSSCYRNKWDVQEDFVGATPPARRCKPFYSNIRCPSGSVKKFVLNSAQPWCDRIPVCYDVAEPVPYGRANRLRRKSIQLDEEDDEYVGWNYPSPPSKPGNWRI
jgi:hypothetical protein